MGWGQDRDKSKDAVWHSWQPQWTWWQWRGGVQPPWGRPDQRSRGNNWAGVAGTHWVRAQVQEQGNGAKGGIIPQASTIDKESHRWGKPLTPNHSVAYLAIKPSLNRSQKRSNKFPKWIIYTHCGRTHWKEQTRRCINQPTLPILSPPVMAEPSRGRGERAVWLEASVCMKVATGIHKPGEL